MSLPPAASHDSTEDADQGIPAVREQRGLGRKDIVWAGARSVDTAAADTVADVALYGPDEIAERNRTHEVPQYAPELLLIGDDGGGRGFFVARDDRACWRTVSARCSPPRTIRTLPSRSSRSTC
ncbi:hypothetical protein [Micromonospora sp. DT233]|uniref:hypothetical protein n=1 Tax=Micromonospora sp. DT233 TaxID=3393432 RepID=UPI003CF7C7AB